MYKTRNIPLRDLVLSIPEAIKATGLARETIEGMIAGGQLDTVTIGRRDYVSKPSLDRIVDEVLSGGIGRTTAASAAPAIATTTDPVDPAEAERLLAAECGAPASA